MNGVVYPLFSGDTLFVNWYAVRNRFIPTLSAFRPFRNPLKLSSWAEDPLDLRMWVTALSHGCGQLQSINFIAFRWQLVLTYLDESRRLNWANMETNANIAQYAYTLRLGGRRTPTLEYSNGKQRFFDFFSNNFLLVIQEFQRTFSGKYFIFRHFTSLDTFFLSRCFTPSIYCCWLLSCCFIFLFFLERHNVIVQYYSYFILYSSFFILYSLFFILHSLVFISSRCKSRTTE